MKLIHLSDLHLGKRIAGYSMMEEQEYILKQILAIADEEKVEAVLIAGDVYDRSVASEEAIALFDDFLVKLADRDLPVLVISGNHDSNERMAFGARLMEEKAVYISRAYNGTVQRVRLTDEYGDVDVYLLPFLKPAHVRRFYGEEEEIKTYTDGVRVALSHAESGEAPRKVLIAHQFVTGAERSDSEETVIGGLDNVDASVFDGFDYVALGHIHGPQNMQEFAPGAGRKAGEKQKAAGTDAGRKPLIRYCGSPLKYSFSELHHEKSVTVVELKEPGNVSVSARPLTPLHDWRGERGTFAEIESRGRREEYTRVILTDEEEVPNAMGRLRRLFPRLMSYSYDNARTRWEAPVEIAERPEEKTPLELFEELFEKQNGRSLTEEERKIMTRVIEEVWEEE